MASLNKVTLIGNLGKDPEVRYMQNGDAVTQITIATTDTWKDKASGDKKEATEWHRVVMFRRLAEIAGQYLKKGASVYIEGSLKTRKWQDKAGQDRYTTEIIASEMKMLGGKGGGGAGGPLPMGEPAAPGTAPAAAQSDGGFEGLDDDIPF